MLYGTSHLNDMLFGFSRFNFPFSGHAVPCLRMNSGVPSKRTTSPLTSLTLVCHTNRFACLELLFTDQVSYIVADSRTCLFPLGYVGIELFSLKKISPQNHQSLVSRSRENYKSGNNYETGRARSLRVGTTECGLENDMNLKSGFGVTQSMYNENHGSNFSTL